MEVDLASVVYNFGQLLGGTPHEITLTALFWASAIEYILPVFPGDSVTVAGAVMTVTSGLPWFGVFLMTAAGGLVGSAVHFKIGRMVLNAGRKPERRHPRLARIAKRASSKVSGRISRWGVLILVANRFLPGIRSALFIAAGMSGMSWLKAMAAGTISSLLWTALLLTIGMQLGANLDRIQTFFRNYSIAAWFLMAVLLIAWTIVVIIRKKIGRKSPSGKNG